MFSYIVYNGDGMADSWFKLTGKVINKKVESMMQLQPVTKKLLRLFVSCIKYLLIFILVYLLMNWWRQPVMPVNPQLQLIDHHGETVDLKTMSEQSPVLIYFWGSWCGVCHVTSPKVNQLALDGYSVVTVAVKSGNNEELENYLSSNHINFITINDKDGRVFADWKGQVTPSYLILNKGKMTQGLTGIQPLWSLKLRMWISSGQDFGFF